MDKKTKLISFEYLINKLICWYNDIYPNGTYESFSRLKTQKLLFLSAVINADIDKLDLLSVFDNFCAMKYGPVESDIYYAMMNDEFETISFIDRYIKIINDMSIISHRLDEQIVAMIDNATAKLRSENNNLITYTALDLVNITHKWKSWQEAIAVANALGKDTEKIDIDSLCADYKYFKNE